jgi:3'(2'), 5'-bisphosphate nucleotidase
MAAQRELDRLADAFADMASTAGRAILDIYDTPFAARMKADRSPVTDADMAAEAIIVPALRALLPGVPVVAEEACADGDVPAVTDGTFLLVDPLDGTREFTSRNGEFTVNIALIQSSLPVCGVVYAPVSGVAHLGGTVARRAAIRAGARFEPYTAERVHTRLPATPLLGTASRSHCDQDTLNWLAAHAVGDCVHVGSALKFGVLAEGRADVYPRFTPTSEWDTAAGQAVLSAAGGCVLTLEGSALRYGKPGFVNGPFIAWGRRPA